MEESHWNVATNENAGQRIICTACHKSSKQPHLIALGILISLYVRSKAWLVYSSFHVSKSPENKIEVIETIFL
jgi:hypothetical protein